MIPQVVHAHRANLSPSRHRVKKFVDMRDSNSVYLLGLRSNLRPLLYQEPVNITGTFVTNFYSRRGSFGFIRPTNKKHRPRLVTTTIFHGGNS